MDPFVGEWLSLVVRWVHVVTGIAWIGASFYFNWLLNHLRAPAAGDAGVAGELWAIHAGGFFKVEKRDIAPGQLPRPLHWFKWEAYWTWISGFMLLVIVYYAGAGVYLIDPSVAKIGNATAIGLGAGTLVVSWVVYDALWRSPLARRPVAAVVVSLLLVIAVAIGLEQVFSARGAYIHVGALLGTLMAGNVFRVIMPAQRRLVAATEGGAVQDPRLAASAELRSLHNNYLTLPVLFIMISNHYPSTYGYRRAWLVLALLLLAGGVVRHYFNVRHRRGNVASAWLLVAAAAMVAGAALLTAPPAREPALAAGGGRVAFAEVEAVIKRRCVSCHSARPTSALFPVAPKNVMLDTPEQIRRQAVAIRALSVVSTAMPLANITHMTPAERALLGAWIDRGAPLE